MARKHLRFGVFMAPFHPENENPFYAYERDMQLIQHLDDIGYDEAWIGEHHSAGFEIIPSPELFIAAVAERTKHIRLGTGVSSLPYHHPLILADRIAQLAVQTRGRTMFGVGPGALPSDAFMMGIDPATQRDRMDEALSVIVPLLQGDTVTYKCDWFELNEARIQLANYNPGGIEMAVASQISPAGARAAGKYGLGLLSIGATNQGGFDALRSNWEICEARAEEFGQTVDRNNWRVVGPMHIAETREQALADVKFGLADWVRYFTEVAALPLAPGEGDDPAEALIASGFAVIGTPDDAIAQIARLEEESGGFGCVMQLAHNWADTVATRKSYELMARYVMPRFQETNERRINSLNWAKDNHDRFMGAAFGAVGAEIEKHQAELAEKSKDAAE